MRRSLTLLAALALAFSAGWAARDHRSELLAIHEAGMEAHRKTDVSMLGSGADPFITVSDGKINRITPTDERSFFTDYFKNARYPTYEDAEAPIVGVSKDGTLGYVISRVRAHRIEADAKGNEKQVRFVYAGIMVYEKQNGKYVRVANVSTFEP